MRAVLIISHFKKLERVFFGGRGTDGEVFGLNNYVYELSDRAQQMVITLLDQISEAFQYNLIPRNLRVMGLCCPRMGAFHEGGGLCCPRRGRSPEQAVGCCLLACKTWPLEHVMKFDNIGCKLPHRRDTYEHTRRKCLRVCLTSEQLDNIIRVRPGGNELLHSKSRLLHLLGRGKLYEILSSDGEPFYYTSFSIESISEMKRAIEVAELDVDELSKEQVTQALMRSFAKGDNSQIPQKSQCYLGYGAMKGLKDDLKLPFDIEDFIPTHRNILPHVKKVLEADFIDEYIRIDFLPLLSRFIVHGGETAVQEVANLGMLSLLVGLLDPNRDKEFTHQVTYSIGHIAHYGAMDHLEALVKFGAIKKLVFLLWDTQDCPITNINSANFTPITIPIVDSLVTFADKSTRWRDIILRKGTLKILSTPLKNCTDASIMKAVSRLIGTLKDDPKPDFSASSTLCE